MVEHWVAWLDVNLAERWVERLVDPLVEPKVGMLAAYLVDLLVFATAERKVANWVDWKVAHLVALLVCKMVDHLGGSLVVY